MQHRTVQHKSLPDFGLWEKMRRARRLASFDLELTARCNLSCRHCYINKPAGDRSARRRELSTTEFLDIADQAVSQGALWCLLTGGEPLLRDDFDKLYLGLKRKGLLVSIFTNATLITPAHVELFKNHPPRDIEVSVYGVTRPTYQSITGRRGSFAAFTQGVKRLLDNNLKVRFKAVAMQSNLHEFAKIAMYCRERTADYFRFDPFLNLRLDGSREKNEAIAAERLTPEQIEVLEKSDPERFNALRHCQSDRSQVVPGQEALRLLRCGAGEGHCYISHSGMLYLCGFLRQRNCAYDLKRGSLAQACRAFIPAVKQMQTTDPVFRTHCGSCDMISLCAWCPALAELETGRLDRPVPYFCSVARQRRESFAPDTDG